MRRSIIIEGDKSMDSTSTSDSGRKIDKPVGGDQNRPRASLAALFWTFLRIGAFTIGGGYVMVPLIQRDIVERRGWIGKRDFVDILAVSQTAPGPLAVNTSVYVGYTLRGIRGAMAAVVGCILPSIIIILVVAALFDQISSSNYVRAAFAGIRPAVVVLIASAAIKIGRPVVRSRVELALAAAAMILVAFVRVSPALVVTAAAVYGLLVGVGGTKG
ncbi:MAG TPA: chromate transporter [Firmicutes bacterium]|nr:chromate transporter [Bacillota bacterium]